MIVHRDYQNSGNSIIKVFDDRIEFFNPGRLLEGLSVAQLQSGNYMSHVRNKKTAAIFKEAGIIEQYGSGISRVIKTFTGHGHLPPTFENFQHGFKVTVFSRPKDVVDSVVDNISLKGKNVLEIIKHNSKISASELAKKTGVSERTAQRQFKTLQDKKAIKRIGPPKGGHWEVAVHS